MSRIAPALVLALVTAASAASAAAPPAARPARQANEPPPSTDQMYAAFERADYAKVLKQVAAALALKGDAAGAFDRYELLTLRGETYLRMKNPALAAVAFDEAAKQTKLEEKAAVARVTAELIRRSKKGLYTPPAKKGGSAAAPIDVADPARRQDAFGAMFEEAKPRVTAAAEAAGRGGKLPAMSDVVPLVRDLAVLERASTGAAEESEAIARSVAARAAAVMAPAVKGMGENLVELETYAVSESREPRRDDPAGRATESGPIGLRPDQVEQLRRIMYDCRLVGELCGRLSRLFTGGAEADALQSVSNNAKSVYSMAEQLGAVDWSQYRRVDPALPEDDATGAKVGRPGTSRTTRPARRGNPAAGPRGVDTGISR